MSWEWLLDFKWLFTNDNWHCGLSRVHQNIYGLEYFEDCFPDYLNPVPKDQIVRESGLRSTKNPNDLANDYFVTELDPIELGINMSTNAESDEVLFGEEFNLNYFGIVPGNNIMAWAIQRLGLEEMCRQLIRNNSLNTKSFESSLSIYLFIYLFVVPDFIRRTKFAMIKCANLFVVRSSFYNIYQIDSKTHRSVRFIVIICGVILIVFFEI